MQMKHFLLSLILLSLLTACQQRPHDVIRVEISPNIYPDYKEVTIPAGIAPLNFALMDSDNPHLPADIEQCHVVVYGAQHDSVVSDGPHATDFDIEAWRQLTEQSRGGVLTVSTYAKRHGKWFRYENFQIYVSTYPLEEYGVTYRKMAPGYVLSTDMGIYQRDLHSFHEEAIVRNTEIQGHCIGCHTSNRTHSQQFSLHVRGRAAATIMRHKGQELWLNTQTDSTLSKCVYPSWHPAGRYIAYSLNLMHQMFWATGKHHIEVFDVNSDLVVVDADQRRILRSPLLEHTADWMETYPAFSAQGDQLYFCRSPFRAMPEEIDSLRYSLCRIAFDGQTGTFGDSIETLIDGDAEQISITFPRPSYDQRWLVYSQCHNGGFSIQHEESDLFLLDLATGERRALSEINSPHAESFCQWNGNSRWLLFASRRDDGLYTRLYLTSINDEGQASKPVLLPQRDPWVYYHSLLLSFNTPDWIDAPVDFDARRAYLHILDNDREPLVTE